MRSPQPVADGLPFWSAPLVEREQAWRSLLRGRPDLQLPDVATLGYLGGLQGNNRIGRLEVDYWP